jgi:hypothetical protein
VSARKDYPLLSFWGEVHPEMATALDEIDRLRADKGEHRRYDRAVDRILNSGLLLPYMPDFFKYCDGKISWKQFDERMSP